MDRSAATMQFVIRPRPYDVGARPACYLVLHHGNNCLPGVNENAIIDRRVWMLHSLSYTPKPRISSNVNFGMAGELRLRYIRGSDLGAVRSGIVAPVTCAVEDRQAFSKLGNRVGNGQVFDEAMAECPSSEFLGQAVA
jgi:hypothetical protein